MDRREAEDDFIIDNDESEMDEDISNEGISDEMFDAWKLLVLSIYETYTRYLNLIHYH